MRRLFSFALICSAPLFTGCMAASGGGTGESEPEAIGQGQEDILNGSLASTFPEAVVLDICFDSQCQSPNGAACSGSLIAPNVVMTAGHCVYGCKASDGCTPTNSAYYPLWVITAPFANGAQVFATQGVTYDWTSLTETVNPNMHDIGLVFLQTPIDISSYPTLPSSPVSDGSALQNLCRIHDGSGQGGVTETMWIGPQVTVRGAANQGYPYDYYAQDIIESGDSGGPDVIPGTHTIAAVNSGGGQTEVLARTDLLYSWIQQEIATNGGTGSAGSTGATSTSASTGTGSTQDCTTCGDDATAQGGACYGQIVACENDQACVTLYNCLSNCSDTTCENNCASASTQSAVDEYNTLVTCVYCGVCETACGTAADCSGTTTSTGATGPSATTGTSSGSISTGSFGSASNGAGAGSGSGGNGAGGHHGGNDHPTTSSSDESGGCSVAEGSSGSALSWIALAGALSMLASRRRQKRG